MVLRQKAFETKLLWLISIPSYTWRSWGIEIFSVCGDDSYLEVLHITIMSLIVGHINVTLTFSAKWPNRFLSGKVSCKSLCTFLITLRHISKPLFHSPWTWWTQIINLLVSNFFRSNILRFGKVTWKIVWNRWITTSSSFSRDHKIQNNSRYAFQQKYLVPKLLRHNNLHHKQKHVIKISEFRSKAYALHTGKPLWFAETATGLDTDILFRSIKGPGICNLWLRSVAACRPTNLLLQY
jgi:hypothetical protein